MRTLSPTEQELLSRLTWFVKLRWIFLLALGGVLFVALRVYRLRMDLVPVLIIGFIVLVYNLGFFLLHWLARREGRFTTARDLRIEANLQIGFDLIALVFLIHFTGGIENPFTMFYFFHMILGSILLTGWDIWLQAALTLLLLFALLVLSYFGYASHHHISGFASEQLFTNVPYLLAASVSFVATVIMTIYMTHSIARSLRKGEEELFSTKTQVENNSKELEQVNRELIRQQSLLIQSEKLASLGKLSAGIAHELNSPLTGVMSFAHFIKDASPQNDQLQHDIKVIIRETERCKKIIKGLLDFARQSQPEKKEHDVTEVLRRTVVLVENHKDFKNIEIIRDFQPNLPRLMFDKDQIQQVFMNLIVNAQEAMPEGGTIYIGAEVNAGGDFVEIEISDTGIGIAPENLSKIFDPFFTSKEMGTGLGLSISMGIVENHGGQLKVESSLGEGTTFTILLPVKPAEESKK